ncbi:stage V sporulation protein AD [Bacillus sp. FSL W7-1360]
MGRYRKKTLIFQEPIYVQSSGTSVGPREGSGPLAGSFDEVFSSLYCGEKNWEAAEKQLLRTAIDHCLTKGQITRGDVDLLIAGDLSNQMMSASMVACDLQIPYAGVYSAGATLVESMVMAALWINGGFADHIVAATSSHYGVAEKQWFYPTEFAMQKPLYAQTIVTGSGAILLGRKRTEVKVTEASLGIVYDFGVNDPFHLGAVLAPAVAETTLWHLEKTKQALTDFDLIVTGDLGAVGTEIYRKILREKGLLLSDTHMDCGVMMYCTKQHPYAGGSGAGCAATVVCGHLLDMLKRGKKKRMLVVTGGVFLNTTFIGQKQSIPTIAHAIVLEREE